MPIIVGREKEENYIMKKTKRAFSLVSSIALVLLVTLILVSVATNIAIISWKGLAQAGYPRNTLGMLFDYSRYAVGHPARLTGQILSNIVAYLFMIAGVVIFILSLVLIKHDKLVRAKCAIIALFVFVPATFGLTGGIINFLGEGLKTLLKMGGRGAAVVLAAVLLTFLLDVLYLGFAIASLKLGIGTAIKFNKGEIVEEPEEEFFGGYREETAEEKAAREEKEAADRVALLEEIRKIVKEELDKLDRVAIIKEAAPVFAAPAAAPAEEEEEKGKAAPRIPFAQKIVKADKDIQEKYNELKSEILAYGAKSRVSVAGDTFRLHRKAYVKITLVGKTLKVYFALDPKDFVESPIPVVDAGDKASYEEVPALLKVKSNLSVKRAKELVRLALEKDGVKKEEDVVEHNWVKDIRAELKAAGKK